MSDLGLMTEERLISLLQKGAWLMRNCACSPLLLSDGGELSFVNQELAKRVSDNPRVRVEEWREGWGYEIRGTGKFRYVID